MMIPSTIATRILTAGGNFLFMGSLSPDAGKTLLSRRVTRQCAASTPPGLAQLRIELVQIGLDLLAAAFVDELPPPYAPGVGQAHPGRGQLALDVVDAFAEHDLYAVRALAVDHDVQGLPGFGYAHLYFLRFHRRYAFASSSSFSKRRSRDGPHETCGGGCSSRCR